MADYIVIATWPFGQTAVREAVTLLDQGKPALDAAIAGAQAVEDDPAVHSVGFGGLPNAAGTVQLDACVMDGRTLACGGVAGLEGIRHPAALARLVMEKTPHLLLVGESARWFALQQGFKLETLTTPESIAEWEKRRKRSNRPGAPALHPVDPALALSGHDTVTVLARDKTGSFAGACSTSGLANKLPGRVGDSPIIGAGLYVDNAVGGAGGTGNGEEIIRAGGSTIVIEAMRSGKSAQEACELGIQRVNAIAVRRGLRPANVAFLALDARGNPAGACTARTNFQYAIARPGKLELLKAPEISPETT
jgi:isoaspartyl peptidase/L-asparaginase-like protein (Ntn-hydrolase superfamily)